LPIIATRQRARALLFSQLLFDVGINGIGKVVLGSRHSITQIQNIML
jgi:hypothetical protein